MRLYVISATRGGDGWLWYAMGLAIAILGGKTRFEAMGAAGSSSVLSILLFICLKRLTGRRGPARSNRTAGLRCFRPINFRFPPATP